jgi:hypothetical protein
MSARNQRPPMVDTAMKGAFLAALHAWAARHPNNTTTEIAIPTGRVESAELVRVLRALGLLDRRPS